MTDSVAAATDVRSVLSLQPNKQCGFIYNTAYAQTHRQRPHCTQAAVTASYGDRAYCGNGLNASLSVCSVPLGTGSGPVNISLPTPTAVTNFVATPATITL